MRQAEEIRIRSLEVKPQSATCKAAPQPYQLPTTTPALYVWKPGMNSAGAADRLLQAFARCVYDKERITEQYKLCFTATGVCPASDGSGDARNTGLSMI